MHNRKIKFSFASVTTLVAILVLGVGLVWASPLVDGGVYMPLVMKGYPTATPTITPTVTPTATPTRTPTPTNPPPPAVIVNPGFEQNDGWTFQSNQGDPIRVSPFAHSGSFSAALGNGNNNRIASIAQQFTVPYDYYNIQYWKYIQSIELCGVRYDFVTAYVNGIAVDSFNVCQDLSSTQWTKQITNLRNYRGQTIVFRLEFRSDGNTPSYFNVDDFSFQ